MATKKTKPTKKKRKQFRIQPLVAAVGTTMAISLASIPLANASSTPFSTNSLNQGYQTQTSTPIHLAGSGTMNSDKMKDGKCGAGKCSADKKKGKAGKCGTGKCGADKKKGKEGHCKGDNMKGKNGSCGSDKGKGENGSCGGKK